MASSPMPGTNMAAEPTGSISGDSARPDAEVRQGAVPGGVAAEGRVALDLVGLLLADHARQALRHGPVGDRGPGRGEALVRLVGRDGRRRRWLRVGVLPACHHAGGGVDIRHRGEAVEPRRALLLTALRRAPERRRQAFAEVGAELRAEAGRGRRIGGVGRRLRVLEGLAVGDEVGGERVRHRPGTTLAEGSAAARAAAAAAGDTGAPACRRRGDRCHAGERRSAHRRRRAGQVEGHRHGLPVTAPHHAPAVVHEPDRVRLRRRDPRRRRLDGVQVFRRLGLARLAEALRHGDVVERQAVDGGPRVGRHGIEALRRHPGAAVRHVVELAEERSSPRPMPPTPHHPPRRRRAWPAPASRRCSRCRTPDRPKRRSSGCSGRSSSPRGRSAPRRGPSRPRPWRRP